MRIKKISALVVMAISLAGLAGCSTSKEPQTETVTQQAVSFNIDYQTFLAEVSLTVPSSWTVDTNALTISKGESSFFFAPDYSTDEIKNPNIESSTVTTNSGKTLVVDITTNKDDSSEKAHVLIGDLATSLQNPSFHFSFEAPIDELDAEFYEILKTISWEGTVYKK